MKWRVVATYLNLTQELGAEFSVKTLQSRWKWRIFMRLHLLTGKLAGTAPAN